MLVQPFWYLAYQLHVSVSKTKEKVWLPGCDRRGWNVKTCSVSTLPNFNYQVTEKFNQPKILLSGGF